MIFFDQFKVPTIKLGFTGVNIIFALEHIEAVLTCIHNLCFEEKKREKYHNFSSENYRFYSREKIA